MQNENFPSDRNMVYNDAFDNTEYRLFEDMTANHCPLHELEINFKCTPECHIEILQALNIEKDYENNCYEHACI